MRADPSMNNHRGEFGSPHISIPMNGDMSKIDPLVVSTSKNEVMGGNNTTRNEQRESREMGSSPAGNSKSSSVSVVGSDKSDVGGGGGYQQSSLRMPQIYPKETPNNMQVLSNGLPQARQNDPIFRESHVPTTSWSNVVSSNAPSSPPTRMTARSFSGETLLTNNMTQPTANSFQYLGRSRSHSFDAESPPHTLLKSFSFGNPSDTNQQSGLGFPPSHPGHSSYKDSTLPTINQGALHSPSIIYPSTPYREFKPRSSSMGSYSPISLGDSMTTDQTSPMSSPSLSPHVSPAMTPRRGQRGDGPPMWQLSDANNEFHSELPSNPHNRLHSHLPQSIPEHHRQEPHNLAHHGHHHSYMTHHGHGNTRFDGPTSPPKHLHSPSSGGGNHHHHHSSMYPRRPGPKPYSGPPTSHTPAHHRSSTEVLKTLLRKKACLYEPETSFAVSLVTWLVGRHLALSQGYFTRQQLQAGVHSCVAGKIEEGHVTRTKVNRCMQVILNSCFHYIIPRPDGSEECGKAFRIVFSHEAADEEHLLGTLPPPWNDLNLHALSEEESHSSLFHDSDDDGGGDHHQSSEKPPSKEAESQACDSLDSGGKRSVLLCFNENIRSAADVFRCHNEFIRDVAHTGNLSLTPEDWQSFFSGTKTYRKRSASIDSFQSRNLHFADIQDRMDQQGLSKFRTSWCAKRYDHDHSFCAFAHVDINRGWLRRDPFVHNYNPTMCPYIKPVQNAKDCYVNMCPLGVNCNHSHSKEEILYHPESYKRQQCRSAPGSCPLGDICPNTHAELSPQSYGYNRQGNRHHNDHSPFHRATPGSKRRVPASTGHVAGFTKLPDGSPMLYIDPAPLSEFEKTLSLPGLQAIFRDHSSSIFYSTMINKSPYEYGSFGYRNTEQNITTNTPIKPIGKSTGRLDWQQQNPSTFSFAF